MNRTKHHIRKQVLDFRFPEKIRAVEWQRNVSAQYQQEYLGAIASVFNEYEDGSQYYIDTIELDLGSASTEQLLTRIKTELRKALIKKLRKKSAEIPDRKKDTVPNEWLQKVATTEKKEVLHSFTFFLGNGYFPWSADMVSVAVLEKQLRAKWPVSAIIGQLVAANLLYKKPQRTRLYHQFSLSFATEIVAGYFQVECITLKSIYEFLESRLLEPVTDGFSPFRTTSEDKVSIIRWVALEAGPNPGQWPIEFAEWYLISRLKKKKTAYEQRISNLLTECNLEDRNTEEMVFQLDKIIRKLVDYRNRKRQQSIVSAATVTSSDNDVPRETGDRPEAQGTSEGKKPVERTITSEMEKENRHTPHSELAVPDISKNGEIQSKKSKFKKGTESNTAKESENESRPPTIGSEHPLKGKKNRRNLIEENRAGEKTAKQTHRPSGEQKNVERGPDYERPLPKDILIYDGQTENSAPLQVNTDNLVSIQTTPDAWEQGLADLETSIVPEGYYLTHAGLVLSWPYLSQLFEKLDYTEQKRFIAREQRERAVLLLGFLATGDPYCEEQHLILSKFLCGWPIEMPVVKNIILSKKEQKEATAMLKALIGNWKILKNTSIAGLRETFFLRDGKLVDEEEHWKLTVEQKGTDILLDHLPYGLSIIKLPWLKKLLKVDWA